MDKLVIYVDCDDTILHSSETVINILNNRYNVNKSIQDLKDWHYRSIVSTVTPEEILSIYSSDEFWEQVKINEKFLEIYNKFKEDIKWVIVSKGDCVNLLKKQKFIGKNFKDVEFRGLILNDSDEFNKSLVDMSDGIQIDDNINCLTYTNSPIKVILKNNKSVYWNKVYSNMDNLYAVENWELMEFLIEYFLEHRELVRKCYYEDITEEEK